MKSHFEKLPQRILELISKAGKSARRLNAKLYLVGGFVRDMILAVPNLDLDMVVEGEGIELAADLAEKIQARILVHKRFKTATLITNDKIKIDIATARSEIYKAPAQLPVVTDGDIKDDLGRRDFTINAMAIQIEPFNPGALIDIFAGRDDIRKKKIRVLHDLSFIDDPTRILRAIRFEKRYGFKIEPHTLRLLKQARQSKMLTLVNPHRLKNEIISIFKEAHPLSSAKRLRELWGLSFISPRLGLNQKKIKFFDSLEKTICWFNREFPRHRKLDAWLMYVIGLVSNLNPKEIQALFNRFAFSRGEAMRAISFKKAIDSKLEDRLKLKMRPSQLHSLLEPLSYEVILMIKARSGHKLLNKNIVEFLKLHNGIRTHLKGSDLVQLGIPRGPHYQKILRHLLYARLDKKVKNRDEELRLVKQLVKR